MREVTTIKLSNCEVDIVTYITWGEREQLEKVLLSGANMTNVSDMSKPSVSFNPAVVSDIKYKAFEVAVKEIRETDGTKHGFTAEWINNLRVEDGDLLYVEVDKVTGKKKS